MRRSKAAVKHANLHRYLTLVRSTVDRRLEVCIEVPAPAQDAYHRRIIRKSDNHRSIFPSRAREQPHSSSAPSVCAASSSAYSWLSFDLIRASCSCTYRLIGSSGSSCCAPLPSVDLGSSSRKIVQLRSGPPMERASSSPSSPSALVSPLVFSLQSLRLPIDRVRVRLRARPDGLRPLSDARRWRVKTSSK